MTGVEVNNGDADGGVFALALVADPWRHGDFRTDAAVGLHLVKPCNRIEPNTLIESVRHVL